MKGYGKAGAVGASFTLMFAVVAFWVFPRSWVTTVFVWPGVLLLPLAAWVVPDGMTYRITPDGGPLAALPLVLAGAALFWVVFLGFVWQASPLEKTFGSRSNGGKVQ